MNAESREGIRESVSESEIGRVVDEFEGDLIVMPALVFDDEQIPDIDLDPFLIEHEGKRQVPIPRHLPRAFRGGFHIVAPHHVAMMWSDLNAGSLREEVQLRQEHDLPVPEIAHQRLEREVYR